MEHVQEGQRSQGHRFTLLFSSEEESDEEVLQACAAIVVADALLEKPKRRIKKLLNYYLLERTTKGSYGGLLTELSLENEIFKEYLRMIQSISVSSEILFIQYFCIHHRYCILQRYRYLSQL